MAVVQRNNYAPLFVAQGASTRLVDVFEHSGKKVIELAPHSSFMYLIVSSQATLDIEIRTMGPACSCTVFGLFFPRSGSQFSGSINISLNHSHTSAEVDLMSFLGNDSRTVIDGSIAIGDRLDRVHGRLLQQHIVLGDDIQIKTVPQLLVASHNVSATHGAKIDGLDLQKLFYMMSRGLSKTQSQSLLIQGYVDSVLEHFGDLSAKDLDFCLPF